MSDRQDRIVGRSGHFAPAPGRVKRAGAASGRGGRPPASFTARSASFFV
jgi:hypothetical protein